MGWMIVVWGTICDQGGPVMASQMVCGDMYGSHILLGDHPWQEKLPWRWTSWGPTLGGPSVAYQVAPSELH